MDEISADGNSDGSLPESRFLPESHSLADPNPEAAAANKGSRNTRIHWTAEMTDKLVETLKVLQDQGKQCDTGWQPEAWTVAQEAVIGASQNRANPSIAQVKSKVDYLRMRWKDWVELGKTSGFGWSEESKLYEADDYVWNNHIKSHKKARWHRNNTLHNRDVLAILFTNVQANGDGNTQTAAPPTDAGDVDVSQYNAFLNSQHQRKSPKRKRVISPDTSEDEDVIASGSKQPSSKNPLYQMRSETAHGRKTHINQVSPSSRSKTERAIALLYSDYDNRLDLDSFVKAVDFIENESKASIFLALKPGLRRDRWLELHLDTEFELGDVT